MEKLRQFMVYASAVITYTVYIECVNQSLADEFLQWLEHDHVRDVVQAGALRGEVCVLDHDPPRIACRYEFASREAFHAYEVGPAIELRKEGVERFGSRQGIVMRREIGEIRFRRESAASRSSQEKSGDPRA